MSDNLDPSLTGNQDPKVEPQAPVAFRWHDQLGSDLSSAPSLKKFADTKDGLLEIAKSYVNLEKLLGNEKVPIPKGPEDTAAWTLFKQGLKIPQSPDGYNLADVQAPENAKGLAFDKAAFAAMVHKANLTPEQAKALWSGYTESVKAQYANAVKGAQEATTNAINQLRSEWGDSYQSQVELGTMVINKFAGDQETADFLTASLVKDARGIKFLAKLGAQFSENKIGDFKYQRYSKSPDEAQRELDEIRRDTNHAYTNPKATQREREAAVAYVNELIKITMGAK